MHTPCNRIPSLCFLFCSLFLLPRIFSFGHALSNTMRLPACKSASACVKRTVLRLDECAMIIQHTIKFNKVCRVALYRQWLTQLYYNGSIFKIYILFNFFFFFFLMLSCFDSDSPATATRCSWTSSTCPPTSSRAPTSRRSPTA